MTYRLEPGLARITSPITLHLPTGEKMEFESGIELVDAVFDKKYRVVELKAKGDVVEIRVEETTPPEINAIGEETFF